MPTKQTKIQRLVTFLNQSATSGRPVSRSTITRRFGGDPSYVVYFNGLRRNGAISTTGRVNVSRINGALTKFRNQNRQKQLTHYQNTGVM